jgi:hypothetical protein
MRLEKAFLNAELKLMSNLKEIQNGDEKIVEKIEGRLQ